MIQSLIPNIHSGFYSPWRATGEPLFPNAWRGCIGAWNPVIGPSGATLFDWSGYQNHGTLTNMDPATDWVVGQYGWMLDVDGTSDHILVNGSSSRLNTSTGSMTIWAVHRANAQHSVFEYGRSGSTAEVIGIRRTSVSQTDMRYRVSNTNYDVSFTISADVWYHYAITWSGGTINGYLNGSAGTPVTGVSAIGTINQGVIGTTAQGTIGSSRDFEGNFFDARLYDRALLPSEIIHFAGDPYAPYRVKRRSARHFVIGGGGPLIGDLSEAAESSDSFAVILNALCDLTEAAQSGEAESNTLVGLATQTDAAQSGETYTGITGILSDLSESAESTDTHANTAVALATTTEAAQSSDQWANIQVSLVAWSEAAESSEAYTNILVGLADLTEAAESGETWVGDIGAITANWGEAAESGQTWTNTAVGVVTTTEAATSGETISNTSLGLVSVTEAAEAAEAIANTLVALGTLTEAAESGETWTGSTVTSPIPADWTEAAESAESYTNILVGLVDLTEAAESGEAWTNVALALLTIEEGATSGDSWEYAGVLVVGPFCVDATYAVAPGPESIYIVTPGAEKTFLCG